MTTFHEVTVTCPCCHEEFPAPQLTSTNTFGGQTTDFYNRAAGFQPLDLVVAACPTCGYSDYTSDIQKTDTIPDTLKHHIADEITPQIRAGRFHPSLKYATMAKIAHWKGESHAKIADLYLRAAWCCVEYSGAYDQEAHYRREAITYFEDALTYGEFKEMAYWNVTYLIGELYRRIGEQDSARVWFDRVLEVSANNPNLEDLAKLTRAQRDNPKQTMREVFGR